MAPLHSSPLSMQVACSRRQYRPREDLTEQTRPLQTTRPQGPAQKQELQQHGHHVQKAPPWSTWQTTCWLIKLLVTTTRSPCSKCTLVKVMTTFLMTSTMESWKICWIAGWRKSRSDTHTKKCSLVGSKYNVGVIWECQRSQATFDDNVNTLVVLFRFPKCFVCGVEQFIDDLKFPNFPDMEWVPLPQNSKNQFETYTVSCKNQ